MVGRSVLEETFSSSTMTPYRDVKQWQSEVKVTMKSGFDTTVVMAGDINKFPKLMFENIRTVVTNYTANCYSC